ncbi:pentatricopeptide repeat-containing protein [Dorcoceras hygrometricum]|uniref:Pentatricopeptide repeat-containing protein n=1 Tax=Dorcoceras hygrometricum TaxID=472368 RepID=A0A2Z7B1Q2_9LAMI|nr:pentatricopeptide repeat-containing protein [Dorcoceras hygrometricum]
MEPVDAGNYVQLAHCFASTAKWDGVGESWVQMGSLGLKKAPDWSSIEMQGISNHSVQVQLGKSTTTTGISILFMCLLCDLRCSGDPSPFLSPAVICVPF